MLQPIQNKQFFGFETPDLELLSVPTGTMNFNMFVVTSLIFLSLFGWCSESQRCYNFSLTVATDQKWFHIEGIASNYSEWFSVSEFPAHEVRGMNGNKI